MTDARIGIMPGDFIGPHITQAAIPTIEKAGELAGIEIGFEHIPASGEAFDATGLHLPASSIEDARSMDAVLKGPFGGPPNSTEPKWQGLEQRAILPLREQLGVYANIRPIKVLGEVGVHLSPLKPKIAEGLDLVIVRELTGDLYYGDSDSGRDEGGDWAYETNMYDSFQVRAIIRAAIDIAKARGDKLTWVHKTNVLEKTGSLWREVFDDLTSREEELETGYIHVDAAAAALIGKLKTGTMVTTNMFGDILSDEAAQLTGSLGLGASASLGENNFGLYEPIHGSAPDIEDPDDANPIGTILSAAMMFRHTFGQPEAADVIEEAVAKVLDDLKLPKDLWAATDGHIQGERAQAVGSAEFGKLVLKQIEKLTD